METTTSTTTVTTTSFSSIDPYTFVLPDNFYLKENGYLSAGDEIQYSGSCNPDFVDNQGDDCNEYHKKGWCTWPVKKQVKYASKNKETGLFKIALNCPHCGCEPNDGVNVNDLYAAEDDKKVSNAIFQGKN